MASEDSLCDVESTLSLQVAELEMLSSMFPGAGELEMDDNTALAQVQSFVAGHLPYDALQARLGFTIKLQVQTQEAQQVTLDFVCFFPHEYPNVTPEIFIRAPTMGKSEHHLILEDIKSYLNELERGEICIGPLIEWINENASKYLNNESAHNQTSRPDILKKHDNKFTRMWIYSHHLYSKIKRKDILDFSAELKLTGFSMPGKPGMIVVEGCSDCVEEFWRRIRNMQWKKITMKEKEDSDIESGKTVDHYRKFENFEEKNFDARAGRGRGVHMNLGQLYQYLEQRDCGPIFTLFFGVDGRLAEEEED